MSYVILYSKSNGYEDNIDVKQFNDIDEAKQFFNVLKSDCRIVWAILLAPLEVL